MLLLFLLVYRTFALKKPVLGRKTFDLCPILVSPPAHRRRGVLVGKVGKGEICPKGK